jgi:formimidoylglutamate deiminase
MHVSEQPAENQACHEEYGRTPIGLLSTEGILSDRFTAVHAVHVTVEDIKGLADTGAMVCACPTTERNLGDGIVPVDLLFQRGIAVSLGTDSQAQIDLLEDARELEYHLRLKKLERAVLESPGEGMDSLAHVLLASATVCGARSIGFDGGELTNGRPADFFSIDLNDLSIAGSTREALLPNIVFALDRAAVRDVVVGGKAIVSDGRHPNSETIIESFVRLQDRLWS